MSTTDIEEAIQRGHPASNLFPMLSDAELWELAEDISQHGLQEEIEVYEGLILDGRNRWVGCVRAGVTPRTVTWDGPSPTAHVISKNLKRRHLEPGQRAAVAVEAEQLIADELKEKEHLRKTGGTLALMPESPEGNARDIAADQFDVSPRYVQDAKRLLKDDPETFARVKAGELSIPQARKESPAFVLSPAPEETPEQKGYYGLTRQRLLVRLDAEAVAAVCADPALSLDSFEDLSAWLSRFVDALRARVERPIRVVQ